MQKSAIITTRLLRRAAHSLFSSFWSKKSNMKFQFQLLFIINTYFGDYKTYSGTASFIYRNENCAYWSFCTKNRDDPVIKNIGKQDIGHVIIISSWKSGGFCHRKMLTCFQEKHFKTWESSGANSITILAQKEEYNPLQVFHPQGKSFPLSTKLECITKVQLALRKLQGLAIYSILDWYCLKILSCAIEE